MAPKLKSVDQQVMVITGASSGIGLATARLAAERGARVVLVSRDDADLRLATEEIKAKGGKARYVVADVADPEQLQEVIETAANEFGGFDTWVNNAGVSVYGRLDEVPVEDARRVFETNYWGTVNGSLAALPLLKQRGGALINVGSVVSDRSVPLQGHYAATKQAIKAFTDALRVELAEGGAPVSVTLIKPSAIDTPYTVHARNYMEREPKFPDPVYHPDLVAQTILEAAERPLRDVIVGGGGRMLTALDNMPKLADRYMKVMYKQQKSDRVTPITRRDALWEPLPDDAAVRGNHQGRVFQRSLYTAAKIHPLRSLAALGLALALGAVLLKKQ
jgi:NAD(P)-dependent dehydrogenase (short-subunit alcohol dehydrogenase family)